VPGEYSKRRGGLKPKSPRVAVPLPGVGGYDYPRGPYGATGFPGSTPAARKTHAQTGDGRKDRQLTTTGIWARDTGPEFTDPAPTVTPRPQPPYGSVRFLPGTEPSPGNRFLRGNGTPRLPRARRMEQTSPERRETPVIGRAIGSAAKHVRNDYARRYLADPLMVRGYRPSPNPGKTGAALNGQSRYHPGTFIYGHPDGKPIPGMYPQPGVPPEVTVQSRYVSLEGSQEGYAMDRPLMFARGGVAPYPDSYVSSTGVHHLRGGRMTGERYVGALDDQARIGLDTDAYGISRARGPRHRPVRFEQPQPWTANYYDVPADQSSSAPDLIHQAPSRPRAGRAVRRGRA
jgi:hypothetical protein